MAKNNKSSMEERVECSRLLDLYGGLLSERQKTFLYLHCNEDLSLAEIAEANNVSRQAVHDAVTKGKRALRKYENHLGMLSSLKGSQGNGAEEIQEMVDEIREDISETPLYDNSRALANLSRISEILKQLQGSQ